MNTALRQMHQRAALVAVAGMMADALAQSSLVETSARKDAPLLSSRGLAAAPSQNSGRLAQCAVAPLPSAAPKPSKASSGLDVAASD
jgi:hypothetical protein